jgi:hypothetical protein
VTAVARLATSLRVAALGRLDARAAARVTLGSVGLVVALADRREATRLMGMMAGVSLGRPASEGGLVLTTALRSDGQAVTLRWAETALVAAGYTESAGVRVITIQLPFHPLAVINLGHVYRGDTLTDASLWFTAKTDLSDIDAEAPTIQVSTADGGVVVIDADDGLYQVTLQPNETLGLTGDAVFTFDVQVVTPTPVTRTVRRGTLAVVCDVTRAHA